MQNSRALRITVRVVFLLLFLGSGFCLLAAEGTGEKQGSESCAVCHENEFRLWEPSDHAHAMDHASEATVLGDFADRTFLSVGFDDILRLSDAEIASLFESDPSVAAIRDFALALADAKPGVREKLLHNASPEQHANLEREIAHRSKVGFTRPSEISTAQKRITDQIRQLADEGKINLGFALRFCMFRDEGNFFVETIGRDAKQQVFPVKYVLGIRPLQQYLVEFPDGRIQCLPVAWDTVEQRWYDLYPKERILPDDPLHWTRPLQNWNNMCAACHTTDFRKNFDLKTNTFRSSWSEIRVGCRTCHSEESADRGKDVGSNSCELVNPKKATAPVDSCSVCHARRRVLSEQTVLAPGEVFLDRFIPETPERHYYYPDGQILEEDFEYGSFLQARMYHQGVNCNDCHDPHSLKLKYAGNRLCAQCHSPAIYDTAQHHFHKNSGPDSGANCIDCHMPEAMYMITDRRRDHSMQKPRPELTVDLGVPNACNLCHCDAEKGEDAAWAKNWTDKWYAAKRQSAVGYGRTKGFGSHFAYAIAEGRNADPKGIEPLIAVAREEDEREIRPITRASAIALLGRYQAKEAQDACRLALTDPQGLVRLAAVGAAESWPAEERLRLLGPLLSDPLRAVRTETARVLTPVPKREFSEKDYAAWKSSAREYLGSFKAVEDTAAAHLNFAVFRYFQALERLGEEPKVTLESFRGATETVLKTYQTSIFLDPLFIPSRINLAMLYNERGERDKAEAEFRKVLAIDPEMGEAHYSLGLLLAEESRFRESLESFRKAVALTPNHARMRYNLGLVLLKLDRPDEAETELREAQRLDPDSRDISRALDMIRAKK